MVRRKVGWLLGASVPALAACGSSGSSKTSGQSSTTTGAAGATTGNPTQATTQLPDACTIVTKADAEQFLGVAARPAPAGGTECTYASNAGIAAVTLLVVRAATFNTNTTRNPSGSFTSVQGLGDAAAVSIVPGGGEVQVLKGAVVMDLSARKEDPAHPGQVEPIDPAALVSLAGTALSRL
jgi:hypothetical protein